MDGILIAEWTLSAVAAALPVPLALWGPQPLDTFKSVVGTIVVSAVFAWGLLLMGTYVIHLIAGESAFGWAMLFGLPVTLLWSALVVPVAAGVRRRWRRRRGLAPRSR